MDDKNINNNLNNDGENIIQENINNNQIDQIPELSQKEIEKQVNKEQAKQVLKDVSEVAGEGAATYFGGPTAGKAAEKAFESEKFQKKLDKATDKATRNPKFNKALSKVQPLVEKAKPVAKAAIDMAKGDITKSASDAKKFANTTQTMKKAKNSADSLNDINKLKDAEKTFSDEKNKQKKSTSRDLSNIGTEQSESPDADLLSDIGKFFKNNRGLVFTIVVVLVFLAIIFLPIILIATGVMNGINTLSSVSDFFQDTGEIIWNTITLHGTRTNQNVYLFNIEEHANDWLNRDDVDKNTFDLEKIRIYTNATTFYTNVVNPDAIDEVLKDPDNDDKNMPSDENNEEEDDKVEPPEDLVQFIGTGDELRQKYGSIKDHPNELIPNMFECVVYEDGMINKEKTCNDSDVESDSKKYIFSEETYEKYLTDTYVMREFIECSDCGYDTATDEKKKSDAKKMAEEIISQAKSSYVNYNANDQSNYNAYSIMVSGITVKDNDDNVIGTYSFSGYVQTIVERDAGSYNNEIKKAYALVVISKTLSNSTNGEVTEFDFDYDKVTQSTIDSVEEVIDLKIMREGKVYYGSFDFEKASEVEQQEYETILKTLYGEDISIEESISNGLQLDTDTGFYMRVAPPDKNDINYYGSNSIGLIGECAWYASNRAREITRTLGVYEWNTNSNGNAFCTQTSASHFKTCWPSRGEKCSPKQGAIISWGYKTGSYVQWGHVGIIEKVEGNNVTYSDSASARGTIGFNVPNSQRYENCTSDPNRSCVNAQQKTTISGLSTGGDGRYIICYVYLTDPVD